MDSEYKCVLCKKNSNGYGNNPYPFKSKKDDLACDDCNRHIVIPLRMTLSSHL
jgi:DNA-directed RNA polymerase subunit RPC12/RpoP